MDVSDKARLGQISDAELLEREFVARDPESISNLSSELPTNFESAYIEFKYDVTPPKELRESTPYIWCAHDQKRTHWKGYVMRTEEGIPFLIGGNCGEDIYGLKFNAVEKSFTELVDRKGYLQQLEAINAAFPNLLTALSSLLAHPVLNTYGQLQNEFRARLPYLHRVLADVARNKQGLLTITEQIRDYAAEERRATQQQADEEKRRESEKRMTFTQRKKLEKKRRVQRKQKTEEERPIYIGYQKTLGNLAGADFFLPKPPPREELNGLQARLREIFQETRNTPTEQFSLKKLRGFIIELRSIIEDLHMEVERLQSPIYFFSLTNLERLVLWSEHTPSCGGPYMAGNQALKAPGSNTESLIQLPTNYQIPELAGLVLFNNAVSPDSK